MKSNSPCPCGSGCTFDQCCKPCITGTTPATTAEQLMRSRYTAHVIQDETYLLKSWHPSTRPATLSLDKENTKWIGLKIIHCSAGKAGDETGEVEFVARYKINGKAHRLHENSRFRYEWDSWLYMDGDVLD
ncbi:MAG: YchJ family metal-binding protein [Gammaproteobacteria bacterium]|nr:YchJ family metal-binding protein [Gammaproteobacteria bacterium]